MSSPLVLLTLDELHRCLRAPWLLVGIIVLSVGGWTAIHIGERDFAEQRNTYAELLQVRLKAQLAIAVTTGRSAEPGLRVVRPPKHFEQLLKCNHRRVKKYLYSFGMTGSSIADLFVIRIRNVSPGIS